jgi:hypothetical protein
MWAAAQGFKGKKNTPSGQMEPAKKDKKMMVCFSFFECSL